MLKILKLFFVIVLLGQFSFAQKVVSELDFSGVWILDKNATFSDAKIREEFKAFTLLITQNESEVKISRTFENEKETYKYTVTLYTDKRSEINLAPDGVTEVKSKTFRKKNLIVRKSYGSNPSRKLTFDQNTEKFRLSKDGNKLTVTSRKNRVYRNPKSYTARNLNFDRTLKLIFRRSKQQP